MMPPQWDTFCTMSLFVVNTNCNHQCAGIGVLIGWTLLLIGQFLNVVADVQTTRFKTDTVQNDESRRLNLIYFEITVHFLITKFRIVEGYKDYAQNQYSDYGRREVL